MASRACGAQLSTHGADAPVLVALPPCPTQERIPHDEQRRKSARTEKRATTKSTKSEPKQKESFPNFGNMKLNKLRTKSQEIIA
jgi:hypothetical protein